MRVTIIADASFCHETKAAGYSFWIASDRGKRGGQGHAPDRVVNSIAAEMMALVQGVVHACMFGLLHPGDQLLLQTDCQAAIDAFTNRRNKITPEELLIVRQVNKLIKELAVSVSYKHVKGHTRGADARTWTNNNCDRRAGEELEKARQMMRMKYPKKLDMNAVKHDPSPRPKVQRTPHYDPYFDHHLLGMTEEDYLGYFPGDR